MNTLSCPPPSATPPFLTFSLPPSRAERQAASAGKRARINKLVSAYSEEEEEGGRSPELTQAVQQLCRQADAFVLVVDASKLTEEGEWDGGERESVVGD